MNTINMHLKDNLQILRTEQPLNNWSVIWQKHVNLKYARWLEEYLIDTKIFFPTIKLSNRKKNL